MELERIEAINDLCMVHPLAGTMGLALYTIPTVYVHDTKGAYPVRYETTVGVIQGCSMAMVAYCASQDKPIDWTVKTLHAAGRGQLQVSDLKEYPLKDVKAFTDEWLRENHHPAD